MGVCEFGSRKNTLRFPEWQLPVQEAVRETDANKLHALVIKAETAIFKRQQAIARNMGENQAELKAIEKALTTLLSIKREQLAFPDWERR